MSRVKEYYLLNDKVALESMQKELSRLSDKWDGEDGSPDINIAQATNKNMLLDDPDYIKWLDEHELPPF